MPWADYFLNGYSGSMTKKDDARKIKTSKKTDKELFDERVNQVLGLSNAKTCEDKGIKPFAAKITKVIPKGKGKNKMYQLIQEVVYLNKLVVTTSFGKYTRKGVLTAHKCQSIKQVKYTCLTFTRLTMLLSNCISYMTMFIQAALNIYCEQLILKLT